jgi:peptidoglycan/LPS O-acetylase OafA/YrhL
MKLNPVTWTLCVEVGFYLLLPVLALVRPRALLPAALVAVGLGWNAAVHDAGAGQVAAKALPAFLPYFAVGMAAAAWPVRERLRLVATAGIALVVANGVWHSVAAPRLVNAPLAVLADLPAAAGFGLLIAVVAAGGLRPLDGLSWVGVRSYGLYLWHVPLILFARRVGVDVVFAVPAALAAAAFSWRYVELPALLRSSASRRLRAVGERGTSAASGFVPITRSPRFEVTPNQ